MALTSSKLVLVVDDDLPTRELFEVMLIRQGFKVQLAASGDEAYEGLKAKRYGKVDLILMDLMMPGSGGYDVLQKLQDPAFGDIPILVVSAKSLDYDATEMIRSEPNVKDYLKKPVTPREFAEKIHGVLGTTPPKSFNEWQD